MKVLLVLYKYGVPLNDPACFPVGYMTISSILKKAGHDVTINNQNLYESIKFDGFDVVCFTGFEDFFPEIKRDAAICKEKGIHTVLGGALATFKPNEMTQYVDTVVVGEGENVACRALVEKGIIKGTMPDLNNVPLPDYLGFGAEEYYKRNGMRHISMLTSRGCPYSCRFCSQTCKFQTKDIDHVLSEIDSHGELDAVAFVDNTFNLSKKRFMAIVNKMKTPWAAAIRVDNFDEDMAKATVDNGGEHYVVGVESFRQDKLDMMDKKITVKQIHDCLGLLHKYGINYHANILVGFPGETLDDIISEIKEMPQGYNVFPCLVQPFIGTQFKKRSITQEEASMLKESFVKFAESKNMHVYPTQ